MAQCMTNQYLAYHLHQEDEDIQQRKASIKSDEMTIVAGYLNFENIHNNQYEQKKERSTGDSFDQQDEKNTKNQNKMVIQTQIVVQNKIVFQQKAIDRYKTVFKGSKDDTVQLNINFKTLLVHYFRELKLLNELNQYEMAHVNEFSIRVPSFISLNTLFENKLQNQNLRHKALVFLSSNQCIRRIMTGRCRMKNKLQMVKFIEKLRQSILSEKPCRWKSSPKKP